MYYFYHYYLHLFIGLELYTLLYSNEKEIIPNVLGIIYHLFSLYEMTGKEELGNNLIFLLRDISNFDNLMDEPLSLCLKFAFKGYACSFFFFLLFQ